MGVLVLKNCFFNCAVASLTFTFGYPVELISLFAQGKGSGIAPVFFTAASKSISLVSASATPFIVAFTAVDILILFLPYSVGNVPRIDIKS